MFKRTLALLLAACMMFDSSAITALAAESQTEVVSEVETTETEETEIVSEIETEVVETKETEIVLEDAIIEEETSSEFVTEEAVTEEIPATEEVVTEEEQVTEEEAVIEEEQIIETETVIKEKPTTEEVSVENVTVLNDGEYPELLLDTPLTVTIPGSNGQDYSEVYYIFTVKESGYYNFHADKIQNSYAHVYFYGDEYYDSNLGDYSLNYDSDLDVVHRLEAGMILYVRFGTWDSSNITTTVSIRKVKDYALTKQEDGTYTAETDEFTFTSAMEAGYVTLRGYVDLDAKEGVTLDEYYQVSIKKAGYDNFNSYSLGKEYDYYSEVSLWTEQGTENSIYYVVSEGENNTPIAVFVGDIVLTTQMTDKPYVIYDVTAYETSIVFNAEFMSMGDVYYAPTDGSEAEKSTWYDNGWQDYKITGLQPNTEYYFEFIDYDNNILGREIVKTANNAAEFNYEVSYDKNADKSGWVTLSVDMSNYQGDSSEGYIYYRYVDALGREQRNIFSVSFTTDESGVKSFSKTQSFWLNVLAGESYDIEFWVEINHTKYGKVVKQITVPESKLVAENITLDIAESKTAGYADVSVSIIGLEDSISGELYYRPQGESEYSRAFYSFPQNMDHISNDLVSISIQEGIPYEFVLLVDGVKKEVTATIGTPSIYLTRVGEDEIHPFDWTSTFKVESKDELTDSYYLSMYYYDELYKRYEKLTNSVLLDASNAWQNVLKTSDNRNFVPNTEYKVKWTLSTSEYGIPIYTLYETIKTAELVPKLEVVSSQIDKQTYTITLKEDFKNVASSAYMRIYIRKQGEERFREKTSFYLSSDNGYSNTCILDDLKANTTYEVSLRGDYEYNYQELTSWTFTTPEDTRRIEITGVETNYHYAILDYSLSNMDVAEYSIIHVYIREKGTNDTWYSNGFWHFNQGDITASELHISYYAEDKVLKEGTTYEYKIGFGTNYDTAVSKLVNVCEGTFTTLEDSRRVSANVSANYTSANLVVTLNGNVEQRDTRIYSFYKSQDSTTWISLGYDYVWNTTDGFTKTITGLNAGTTYDYAVVFADNDSFSSPDEITGEKCKATGTFTTKENTYDLEFKLDENKLTYESAVVIVTAKGGTDNTVNVLLTLSSANGVVGQQSVNLKAGNNYTKDITFENLLASTEYTISEATFSVKEDGNTIFIGTKYPGFKFETKESEHPTSIKLNKSELLLNCLPGYFIGEPGYNAERLLATVTPEEAEGALVWESSNPAVATVDENGWVTGNAIGTATITVSSRYDASIKASCEVIVKKYVVGCAGVNKPTLYENNEVLTISKNSENNTIEGLGLYEVDINGNETLLKNVKVTVEKSGIVEWKDEILKAIGLGSTYVIFEKDGIKAEVCVETFLEATGFSIIGFETSNPSSPAIKDKDGNFTLAWDGTRYTAIGMLSPAGEFDATDFDWSLETENGSIIANVDENGVITPCGRGIATLTVTPKNTNNAFVVKESKVTLYIKGRPFSAFATAYAITNVDKKLSDVEFDYSEELKNNYPNVTEEQFKELLKDWSWKNPNTALVTNGNNKDAYYFETVYTGIDQYPVESGVQVYIGKITGVSVYEVNGDHKQTLLTSTAENVRDSITLNVGAAYEGVIRSSDYTVSIPSVKNLVIEQNGSEWTITALKAGTYTLKPEIKVGDKVVAKGSYKITVVDKVQVDYIGLTATIDGEKIDIVDNKIIFNTADEKKNFVLDAVVTAQGETAATKLKWSSSDKTVIDVKADSKNTHNAKVTVKGEGHAVITVVADDNFKYQVTLNVEIQNHAPRVDKSKVTVNTAYDYNNGEGMDLAAANGGILEIVPVYGSKINEGDVKLYDKTGIELSNELEILRYREYEWLVKPKDANLKNGTYDCIVRVTPSNSPASDPYNYKLKVTVTNKKPSVKASMGSAINMFYTNATGDIKVTGTNGAMVIGVGWVPNDNENSGFSIRPYMDSVSYSYLEVSQHENIKLTKVGKLENANVAKGTLTVELVGYKEPFTFKNFTIKTNYKKPSLTTMSSSTEVIPEIGRISNRFLIFDKTSKDYLFYDEFGVGSTYSYDEIICDNDDVELSLEDYWVSYNFNGTKSTKLNFTLDSVGWRESLKVTHSVAVKKPKITLSTSTVIFNTVETHENMVYTNIYLDNGMNIDFSDISIQAADAKSKELMEKDLILLEQEGNRIKIEQKDARTLGEPEIKAGTYKYKLIPYYTNVLTGEKIALNAVTVSVKIVTKPVTAKVSASGTIDLSNGTNYDVWAKKNVVWVDPKWTNLSDGDNITSWRLVGEYSRYFMLARDGHWYVAVSGEGLGKLRSGQAYKLAVEYTITSSCGETYTVISNTFTIKPKQTNPKITISGDKQTMYAAANDISRIYTISLPDYYTILGAYGSLDCNKDGKADIEVTTESIEYGTEATLKVEIIDRAGAVSAKNGKTYTIPVAIKLEGRDGVAKDAVVNIKVIVKR